jgi:hypothetical protein
MLHREKNFSLKCLQLLSILIVEPAFLIAQVPKTYFVSYMCVYMSGFLPIDREREKKYIFPSYDIGSPPWL